jgi:hypothetical protein
MRSGVRNVAQHFLSYEFWLTTKLVERNTDMDAIRQRAAAEVLELGEMLFDSAIDAASRGPAEGEEADALLVDEMRVAAGEFFQALRLLLEVG